MRLPAGADYMPMERRLSTNRTALLNASLCATLFLTGAVGARAQDRISYRVECDTAEKRLKVRIDIPRIKDLTVRAQMPVWMPGAYFMGNFATNVADVHAEDTARKSLHVSHPDPNTWDISANGARAVSLFYTVKNADLEEAYDKPRRGHISGPRTYMYVVGRKAEPVDLDIVTPSGAKLWRVATSIDPVDAPEGDKEPLRPHHKYRARSYDVLADAPVEMGDFAEERFEAGGKPHSVVMYGQFDKIDKSKLTEYCRRIAEGETGFFGDAPFARYIFQFRTTSASNGPAGAGGLEHLGSTEIGTVRDVNDRVRSVIAHEYFHLWNVKRIRPFVLGPFDYVHPPQTANLWWSEGVTSYYGDLLSFRSGLNTREEYLQHLSETITQLQNTPARLNVTADESSMRVWEANNSSGYGGLSYYTKGELVGLCLDLKIRSVTNGQASLDDVMRALYSQCRRGDGPGFEEDDIKRTVNRISGHDLSSFYDSVARSTDELPFQMCLGYAGLSLSPVEPPKMEADAGLTTIPEFAVGAVRVTEVKPDGAAAKAGISVGDRIVGVNAATDMRAMLTAVRGAHPGDRMTITVARGGARSDVAIVMGARPVYQWKVGINTTATADQIRLREAWLTTH